jgi:hypothetical protein
MRAIWSYADGVGVGDALGQVLSLLESTACYCDLDTGLCEDVNSGSCAMVVRLINTEMSW